MAVQEVVVLPVTIEGPSCVLKDVNVLVTEPAPEKVQFVKAKSCYVPGHKVSRLRLAFEGGGVFGDVGISKKAG